MTPMLYPNCRDPRTAVKTDRTKVPVTLCNGNTKKNTEREKPNVTTVFIRAMLRCSTIYKCDPDHEDHVSSARPMTSQAALLSMRELLLPSLFPSCCGHLSLH